MLSTKTLVFSSSRASEQKHGLSSGATLWSNFTLHQIVFGGEKRKKEKKKQCFFKNFSLLDILFWCDNTCPYECVSGQQVSSLQPSQLGLSLSTTDYSGTFVSGRQVCWTAAMLLLSEQCCHFSGQLAVWVPVRKSSLDFSPGQAVCLSVDHSLSF